MNINVNAANDLYFLDSSIVRVYPCTYRGTYTTGSGTHTFNPEARMFTESSFIKPHTAIKNTYLIEWSDNSERALDLIRTLRFVIHGYYVEVAVSLNDTLLIYSNEGVTEDLVKNKLKYVYLQLQDLALTETETTSVLARFTDTRKTALDPASECILDLPFDALDASDNSWYYFTGLAFSSEPLDVITATDDKPFICDDKLQLLTDDGHIYTQSLYRPTVVSVSDTGSAVETVEYITIDGEEKRIKGLSPSVDGKKLIIS